MSDANKRMIENLRRERKLAAQHKRVRKSQRQFSQNPQVQQFFETHGDHVRIGDTLLFEDGAQIESTNYGYGTMREPPEDAYELADLLYQYFEQKCKRAENDFRLYKETLLGQGDSYVRICEATEEDQEAKLEQLKKQAIKARNRLKKAKQELKDETPAWINAKKRQDAENQRRESEHRRRIKDIRL